MGVSLISAYEVLNDAAREDRLPVTGSASDDHERQLFCKPLLDGAFFQYPVCTPLHPVLTIPFENTGVCLLRSFDYALKLRRRFVLRKRLQQLGGVCHVRKQAREINERTSGVLASGNKNTDRSKYLGARRESRACQASKHVHQ